MSTTITNLPETSKVNGSDYLVLDQPDKTVKSTVSNFLTDTGVVLATDLTLQSITKIPSYDNSNVVQAWRDSVATYGYVYFSNHSKNQMTYTVPATAGNAEYLANSKVIIDKNVTLRFDSDMYSLFKSLQYEGEGTFEFTHLNFKTTGGEVDYLAKQAVLNRNPIRMKRVEWSDCAVYAIDGDSFIPRGDFFATSETAVLYSLPDSLPAGGVCSYCSW